MKDLLMIDLSGGAGTSSWAIYRPLITTHRFATLTAIEFEAYRKFCSTVIDRVDLLPKIKISQLRKYADELVTATSGSVTVDHAMYLLAVLLGYSSWGEMCLQAVRGRVETMGLFGMKSMITSCDVT